MYEDWLLSEPGKVQKSPHCECGCDGLHELAYDGPDVFDISLEDLTTDDRDILASMICVINGSAIQEFSSGSIDNVIAADQKAVYEAAIENGFKLLSESGQERLGAIRDTLHSQLAEMASGTINPFEISQYWTQQFDGYKDWEFARLARTESAFAFMTAKLQNYIADGVSEEAIEALNAYSPIHPNCLCDLQVMSIGELMFLYLDTSMEPCVECNDLADQVIALIQTIAGEQIDLPPDTVVADIEDGESEEPIYVGDI